MTDQHPARPRWADLTMNSTREEVLAAVAEHDRRAEEIEAAIAHYSDDQIDWRGDPPGHRRGCYWSFDGKVSVHMGPAVDDDSVRALQDRAGQEDQSAAAPEWGA
jgi:hypothetical protein